MALRWALWWDGRRVHANRVTLLVPYIAWVIAESVHASAVLLPVAGGIAVFQWRGGASQELQARAVWELLIFILNGVIFVLIGLQLEPSGMPSLPEHYGPVILPDSQVSATAIFVRFLWCRWRPSHAA